MTWRTAALLTALLVAGAGSTPSARQQTVTADEISIHPYLFGARLTQQQRLAKRKELVEIAERSGDMARAARHLVVICAEIMQPQRAVELTDPSCVRAKALAEQHGLRDVTLRMKQIVATSKTWSFDFKGAVAAMNDALKFAEDLDPYKQDNHPVGALNQLLGSTLLEMGQYDEARIRLRKGRDICRVTGDSPCAAYSNIWLCRMETQLGDFTAARSACDAAGPEAAVQNDPMVLANLYRMRGQLDAALGRHTAALASLQSAWKAAQAPDAQVLLPLIAPAIVDSLVALRRMPEAEFWQNGLDKAMASGNLPAFIGPQIAMRRGQVAAVRGNLDGAKEAFTLASRSFIHEASIRGHVALARVNREQQSFGEARESLERAIQKIESARTTVTGSALRASYLSMHASAYRELVGIRFDADGAGGAPAMLETAEAGRARGLLDALASAQVAGAKAHTLTASGVQALLGPEDVLVEYVSTDDRLIAVTVTRDRVAAVNLTGAGNRNDLTRRVDFFATLAQEENEAALAPSARRLYADLLAPALDGVPSTVRTLIIAADGPLHRLPFDAIGDGTPVIDRWNVVMVPSASTLAPRMRDDVATAAALIVAAPETASGLPQLIAARDEAAAIRGRLAGTISELSGADATKARLESQSPDRFAVLHFASHAIVDEERPLRSSLLLAGGADARWTAEEIYRSKLRADLVVLSACSTAAGAQSEGEGVMSLSRAFLHAGARATIATLWDVPDAPSPLFADVLYRELATGQPLGAAAAEARRELRRRGAPPRAWAAYVLAGNPSARVQVSARTSPRVAAASVAGGSALALLIGAMLFRRSPSRRMRAPQMATASVVLMVAALSLQFWPGPNYNLTGDPRTTRGAQVAVLDPVIEGRNWSWTVIDGADEYQVALFDDSGRPVGPVQIAQTTFALPESPAASWIHIVARRDGRALAQSSLMHVTR